MSPRKSKANGRAHFGSVLRGDVPTGRNGKHKEIVTAILSDLEALEAGRALKIALADLPDTKANIRSALNRATRKLNRNVSTAVDEQYLYVWHTDHAME